MRSILSLLLSCLACFGQAGNSSIGGNARFGGNVNIPQAPASAEVADTFTDTSGINLTSHTTTTGGYAWMEMGPGFEILSGTCTNNTFPGGASADYVNHTMSSADCTASIDVTNFSAGGSTEVSLAVRYNGAAFATRSAYFITFLNDTHAARIYKVVSGTVTQLGSDYTAFTTAAVSNISIQVSGTTITGFVNNTGNANITATDSAISSAGFVAIGPDLRGSRPSTGWFYDNLKVTVP